MPQLPLRPYWQTTDWQLVRLYLGEVIGSLRRMPARSVHEIVTSPPYYGLRDYGLTEKFPTEEEAATWADSTAAEMCVTHSFSGTTRYTSGETRYDANQKLWVGRVRTENLWADGSWSAYGGEATPEMYVEHTVAICRELYRVLRDDGTMWWNIGDTYGDPGNGGNRSGLAGSTLEGGKTYGRGADEERRPRQRVLPSGNLVGIPWHVALALQADGWILRSDIPWVKRSPMPESVKNRPAKALEYVFMFVKRMSYFYDDEAVKRVSQPGTIERMKSGWNGETYRDHPDGGHNNFDKYMGSPRPVANAEAGRNFWQADLWFDSVDKPHGLTGIGDEVVGIDVTSQGYSGAHFATFPCALVRPFIQAGTSERGCCAECGAPWKRITQRQAKTRERPNDYVKRTGEEETGNSCANTVAGVESRTVGWRPTCECNGRLERRTVSVGPADAITEPGYAGSSKGRHFDPDSVEPEVSRTVEEYVSDLPLDEHPTRPCVVLDPFSGSGTTNIVAIELGRRSIGIDLSEAYLREQAIPRIEGHLLARPDTAGQVAREVRPTTGGKRVRVRRVG